MVLLAVRGLESSSASRQKEPSFEGNKEKYVSEVSGLSREHTNGKQPV